MVLKTFENVHTIFAQFIFQLQYHWLEKVTIPIQKHYGGKKNSPLQWNVLEKILDLKRKSPPDGAYLCIFLSDCA